MKAKDLLSACFLLFGALLVWPLISYLVPVVYLSCRFYGMSWFGTQTIASAIFGLPAGFLTIWIVSLLTAPPPPAVQDLVVSVRYPKSGQGTKSDPLGRDLREVPVH